MPKSQHAETDLSAVVADRAVRNLFGAALNRDAALRDLVERGASAARFFAPLLEDLFCVFYSKSATLNESGLSDRLQQLLIKYVLSEPDYRAIRARTAGDYARSLTATEEFGVMLIEFLATTASAGGVGSKRGASEFMRITGLKFVEEAVVGDGQPAAEGMLVLAKRIQGALEATQILTDVCHSYGLQPGTIRDLPYDQRAEIAARLVQSTNLKRLAELLGRFAAVARARQEKRLPNLPEEVRDVTLGDDWHRFVPQEYVWLVHPSLRLDFYRRLVDRQILQYEPESRERQGRGAIVVCIDTSGSMAGDRDVRAKAAALALLKLAHASGRPYAAILFSSPNQWISFAFDGATVVSRESGATATSSWHRWKASFVSRSLSMAAERITRRHWPRSCA